MFIFRQPWRIRSNILAMLVAFSFLGYVQRTSVAIAAERMMPTLGLSQVQMGWLLTAFLFGYTVFQVPGAILGRWLGSRRTLTVVGVTSVVGTCATCLAPQIGLAPAVFPMLLLARLILGMAQAALFPVASGSIEAWFPARSWAFAQGFLVCGMWLGTAATAPAIAWMMGRWNWQFALYATSIPSLLLVACWQWHARDRPDEHPGVSEAERAQMRQEPSRSRDESVPSGSVWALRRNVPLLLITASYLLMNYVFYLVTFWCFLYLVQDRHFSTLEGGWLATLPFLAAALASAVGGHVADKLCIRFGDCLGLRALPMIALPAAALFLYLTVTAASAYWAVAALSLAFACVEVTEGAYWAAAMRCAPAQCMKATGVLNTGGNLGGILATPVIAVLSATHSWTSVFAMGAGLSIAAAALWIWVDLPVASRGRESVGSRGVELSATDAIEHS